MKVLYLTYQLAVTNKQLNEKENLHSHGDCCTSFVSRAGKYLGAHQSARHCQISMEN